MLAAGRVLCIKPVSGNLGALQAAGYPERIASRQQPRGLLSHATHILWDLNPVVLLSEPQFPHLEHNNP